MTNISMIQALPYRERLEKVVIARRPALAGRRGNLWRLLHFLRNDNLPLIRNLNLV